MVFCGAINSNEFKKLASHDIELTFFFFLLQVFCGWTVIGEELQNPLLRAQHSESL